MRPSLTAGHVVHGGFFNSLRGTAHPNGLAGHFFIKGIGHVLKARILSDFEERIRTKMKRDRLTRGYAAKSPQKDDMERRHQRLRL